jgi:hypothetical protein
MKLQPAGMALFFALIAMTISSQQPVQSGFFGMTMHAGVIGRQPWPPLRFGTVRLWDTGTKWLDINPKPGVYDWTMFDRWLDAAQSHGVSALYTFGGIPTWASGDPTDPRCTLWRTPGSCHAPKDLSPDGGGSDQVWKDFVGAVAERAKGRINYWEVWNEPHNLFFWHGTVAQMVRMTEDLRTIVKRIDPNAIVLSPGTGWKNSTLNWSTDWNALRWMDVYLGAGGKSLIDAVSVHGYVYGSCPSGRFDMNEIADGVASVRAVLRKQGVPNLPIWNTEGSWGDVQKTCTSDPDLQAAFVAQYYIESCSHGLARVFWYAWNDGNDGKLWDPDTGTSPAGTAYGEVYSWLVGASLDGCSVKQSQNMCNFTRSDGSEALAIWDPGQQCSNGACTTVPVSVDLKYVRYLDLGGHVNTIQNNTVPVGLKPIWLESPRGNANGLL